MYHVYRLSYKLDKKNLPISFKDMFVKGSLVSDNEVADFQFFSMKTEPADVYADLFNFAHQKLFKAKQPRTDKSSESWYEQVFFDFDSFNPLKCRELVNSLSRLMATGDKSLLLGLGCLAFELSEQYHQLQTEIRNHIRQKPNV